MAQRISSYARQRDDEYETPAWVTRVVVPYLRQQCSHVWDPANGPSSRIASVLRDKGLDAIATSDNFLSRTSLPDISIDAICTNPLYGFGGRLAELEDAIADINEQLRMAAGDHFTLPPIVVPEPEVDEDAPRQALVSFDQDWAEATRALIERKAYGRGAA